MPSILGRLAHVSHPQLHRAAAGDPPRPEAGAAEGAPLATAVDVAHDDHGARDDAEVLSVDLELLPDGLDVSEVLAQALVPPVGTLPARRARGPLEVDLALRGDEVERTLEVARGERGEDRP